MKHELDFDTSAKGIGAERRGKVKSSGGYFGAMQLAAEVAQRFRTPPGGGRATDPRWTERRLEELADRLHIGPLQVAGLLLEGTVSTLRDEEAQELSRSPASRP